MVDEQNCRICNGELEVVLDLGEIYPSTFLKEDEKISEDAKAPLVLAECKECRLVQLKHTIDLDLMYRQYWYNSSLNKSMVSSLKDVVDEVEKRIKLKIQDVVTDIGCNDGTMLNLYNDPGLVKVGFDPALNLNRSGDFVFINDYFTSKEYNFVIKRKSKVITSIACFYDLPDPNRFVKEVKEILADNGIFVIQFTDLLSMFKAGAFDNICNEHLEYYKLSDVVSLLRKHGLDVIDVSYNDVNGGSVRITSCHEGAYLPSPTLVESLTKEKNFLKSYGFEEFKKHIELTKTQTQNFLKMVEVLGLKCFSLGASTKGATLTQICGITDKQIPYAAEVNKEKFGLRTVGSNIKIISEDEAFEMNPEFFFVPIWHFEKNILSNEKIQSYIRNGGRLVFPLPIFHTIGKETLQND